MSPLTVLQYQIFNPFLIEYIQIFNQKYFIKLNKQLSQCSVKTLILWHSFSTYRDKPEGCLRQRFVEFSWELFPIISDDLVAINRG